MEWINNNGRQFVGLLMIGTILLVCIPMLLSITYDVHKLLNQEKKE